MATKRHERTFQMMENFIPLHNKGYTIPEIAELYNLSTWTVYHYLDEIAKKAGVTREELLSKQIIIISHSGRNFTVVKPIDRGKFNETFELLMKGVDGLEIEIKQMIEDAETMHTLLQEEMR